MPRRFNLRQIEAFKAVIEAGTLSRAADIMLITQPGMSKLIAHLEFDTGLKLFDRVKGRLAPTEDGMALYGEIDRIFTGVRQVENAVEAIRRTKQGRLAIGVLPALSGAFIETATSHFRQKQGNVFCAIHARSSQFIVDWVMAKKLDIGLVSVAINNPNVILEPVLEQPMVCVMPLDHPLAAKTVIEPQDLHGEPFVGFPPDSTDGHRINAMLQDYAVQPEIVINANWGQTICRFVAAGYGVSLVHPLLASEARHAVAVRRFEPEIPDSFQLCRSADAKNAKLVQAFELALRTAAAERSEAVLGPTI